MYFFFFVKIRNGYLFVFFFSSRRRHTRYWRDWSSDVCSSDLDDDDLRLGLTSLVEMGAREAILTRPNGCVAIVGEGSERSSYEVSIEPLEPVSTVGSGD